MNLSNGKMTSTVSGSQPRSRASLGQEIETESLIASLVGKRHPLTAGSASITTHCRPMLSRRLSACLALLTALTVIRAPADGQVRAISPDSVEADSVDVRSRIATSPTVMTPSVAIPLLDVPVSRAS
jgi:hypothetical protein